MSIAAMNIFLRSSPVRSNFTAAHRLAIVNTSHIRSRHASTRTPAYEGHIPLNTFEAAFLTVGSALMSLADVRRGDMIAALGDLTSGPVLPRLRERMLESAEGRQILKDRPKVNSQTVDMDTLAMMPENSFGRAYVTWLERCGVTPDTREPTHYVDDPELAYVMQRYRECHDFYHCICSLPTNVETELALKFFEFANLGIPMTAMAALFGPLRLSPKRRTRLFTQFVPWAVKSGSGARSLITVYWEKRWEQDMGELKRELGILDAPEAKWSKPLSEAKELADERRRQAEAQLGQKV